MLDDFGDAADACGDDGNFASHCLKSRKAEGFELRRKQKKIGGGELFVDGVLLAEKEDVFLETKFADEVFGSTAIRAVADKDEFRGHFGAHNGENARETRPYRRRPGSRCCRIPRPQISSPERRLLSRQAGRRLRKARRRRSFSASFAARILRPCGS